MRHTIAQPALIWLIEEKKKRNQLECGSIDRLELEGVPTPRGGSLMDMIGTDSLESLFKMVRGEAQLKYDHPGFAAAFHFDTMAWVGRNTQAFGLDRWIYVMINQLFEMVTFNLISIWYATIDRARCITAHARAHPGPPTPRPARSPKAMTRACAHLTIFFCAATSNCAWRADDDAGALDRVAARTHIPSVARHGFGFVETSNRRRL